MLCLRFYFFFFFNDPATTEIYTLSLHDALPICRAQRGARLRALLHHHRRRLVRCDRSEEHTSELQSRQYLVCRLLLEKKKQTKSGYDNQCSTPRVHHTGVYAALPRHTERTP